MKKIYVFLGVVALMLSVMVLSCGKKAESKPVTVWIPGDTQEYGFYFDMFENYKQHLEGEGKTFDYSIEQQPWGDYWTKLPLEINKGRGPDLFLAHVAYAEILVPIAKGLSFSDDVLKKFKITDLYVDENNKPVFIPTVFVSKIMYVNTDIVDDWKDYPKTWEALATKALSHTDIPSVIGFDYQVHMLWDLAYQNGERLTNNNEPVFSATALDTVFEWTKRGFVDYLKFGSGSTENPLYEGSAAYVYGEPWMEFWAPNEVKKKIKAFPVPGGKTHHSAELSFGINKNASDEKYAILNNFIEFMLTDKKTITAIVRGNSGVPNNKEITVSYEPFTAGYAVMTTFDNNNSRLRVPPGALKRVYETMLENVLNGLSVQDAISDAHGNADGIDVSRLQIMEDTF